MSEHNGEHTEQVYGARNVERAREAMAEHGATLARLIDVGINEATSTVVLHLTDGPDHSVYVSIPAASMRGVAAQ